MKLKYIGDHEREFPGIGVFRPGEEIEEPGDAAEALLDSGYFEEVGEQ